MPTNAQICKKWEASHRTINPKTNRTIKQFGPTYQTLDKECARFNKRANGGGYKARVNIIDNSSMYIPTTPVNQKKIKTALVPFARVNSLDPFFQNEKGLHHDAAPLRGAPEALQSVERSNKHDVKKMPITHTAAKLRDEGAASSRARGAAHNPLLLQIQHLLWFIYKYIDFTAILVKNINNYDLISKFFIEVPVLPLSVSKNISAGSGTFSIPQYIYARINWHQTFHGQTILEIAKEKCGNPKILELIVKHFPDDMARISDKIQIKNSFFVNKKDASTQTDPVEQETVPVTPSYLIFQKMESIPPARADAFDPVESRTARLRDETPPPPYFL